MLGWTVGARWRISVRNLVPSCEAVGPEDSTWCWEGSEYGMEVTKDLGDEWLVTVSLSSPRYELFFPKDPLYLREALSLDTPSRSDRVIRGTVMSLPSPGTYVRSIFESPMALSLDFPLLDAPIPEGEERALEASKDRVRTKWGFLCGRPFWTRMERSVDGEVRTVGELLQP